ncbi:hypothetical protein G7Z17_g732 [Cylindrodendrum hubeiense]|uniref:Xylanolytic transcriptional activator regulatory domain-containing protein n=1 Tax=Cylindrodendrum hubeiense TaxID=595255 RepID=A0A9P5HKP8_9HYPO|nr:hypothetical protein G7Z17_g732 [Cylindrodendrum hubeiense]
MGPSSVPLEDAHVNLGRGEPEQIIWDSTGLHDAGTGFQPQIDGSQSNWDQQDFEPMQDQPGLQTIQACSTITPVSFEEEMVEDDELFINLFYANFHVAHPFLVPRGLYFSQHYPSFLRLVVHLIGCHFSGTACSETLESIAYKAIKKAQEDGQTGFVLVQALLLFSIALHARNDFNKSVSSLSQAVSLAIELGMYRKDFAFIHGSGSPVLEESLRRTWWELFVTDGFMAALQHRTSFRCYTVETDVPLPCDEEMYVEGAFMTEPMTLTQFDSRIYVEEELPFSSFSYRIEAVRILARALAVAWIHDIHRDQILAIDNALAAWSHYLDLGKAEATNTSGDVDDMLLQAHMLIQYTTMYLHFPRSDIVGSIPTATMTMPQSSLLPVYSRSMHGIKAVEASKRLGNLAALQDSVQKHTPFFLNGLLLSGVVQLSACSLRPSGFQQHFRDRLCLSAGVLKSLSPVWALARSTWRTLNAITLDTLAKNRQPMAGQTKSLGDSAIEIESAALSMADLPWMEIPAWAAGE